MKITKGTKCVLSNVGHYGIFYMSDDVAQFNQDCEVETKPYVNARSRDYIAVQTETKNIGSFETNEASTVPIIVWVKTA
jgi:hypothetical protein